MPPMCRHGWLLGLTFFSLTPFLFGQEPPSDRSGSVSPAYSKEAFVIEQAYAKVKFENDGTFNREDYGRIRIQADAGVQRYGLLTFSYADATGTMEIDYVRVRKRDGTVVVTPPENIQDMSAQITREAPFYSDLREKHVAVKGLAVGDVLEFDIHNRVTKPLIPGQFWLEYPFAHEGIVLEEELEVTVPRDRSLKVKSTKLQPGITDAGAYRVYTWKSSHLETRDEKQQKQEALKVVWEQTRGRLATPDVLLSSFQSWQDVGRWYDSLQRERVKPTAEIQAKATELTKGAQTENAKLQAIYTYVASEYRYIGVAFGIGRYQPHSAADVLANRYGDCKDKHTLLAALLAASGIKAFPALISTLHELDPEVPSPGQLNHVITAVPQSGGLLWLDSTSEVGPFGYLIPPLRDKHALVIAEGQAASLVNTPPDLPYPSSQRFTMTAKLSDVGTLEGQAELTVRGDIEYVLRAAFRSVSLAQWKDLGQRLSYGLGFGGEVSEVNASSPEKIDEPFRVTYKYTRKDYGDWPNHRILIPAPAVSLPIANEDLTPSSPLWLGSPGEITFHSELELPQGYTPEILHRTEQDCESARYEASSSFKDGKLISDRDLVLLRREVTPADYESYKQFHKLVADNYSAFIQLYSQSATQPPGGFVAGPELHGGPPFDLPDSPDADALRLEKEAREAMGRNDMQSAVATLYRAVTDDPRFVRAWLVLGGLLMASHQTDAGVDAFHKAIAADPNQPLTYKLFGAALAGNSRLEEAVSVWQDLIRVAPQDPDGPTFLGATLFQLKRYSEAATALESAVKLNPSRDDLKYRLVDAYLRSGNDDRVPAVLQSIATKDPPSSSLNLLAYEFALRGKELPLALEYATKAVADAEKESQDDDLEDLVLKDIGHAGKVAAYWDTIGWVYARMSQWEHAETYLEPAWALSLDGLTGAHLCHVYDSENKVQAALRTCRLALFRLPMAKPSWMDDISEETANVSAILERLRPGSSKLDNMGALSDELNQWRSFKLPHILPGTAKADFFVLLVSDGKTPTFKVNETKFIKGSEKLRFAGKYLLPLNFKLNPPDTVPTHIVRRGVLGCYQYSGCEFVLLEIGSGYSLD